MRIRLSPRLAKALLLAAGAAVTLYGIFDDGKVDAGDIRTVGGILILAASMCLLRREKMTKQALYQEGFDVGHSEGFTLGKQAIRPVVVPIAGTRCDRASCEKRIAV